MKYDTFNCRNKDNCTLNVKCLVECNSYEATVSLTETHFGSAEGGSKSRYNNYTLSFRWKGCNFELPKHISSLKDSNNQCSLRWCIKKAMPYKCGSQKCDLCLAENIAIARIEGVYLLNKQIIYYTSYYLSVEIEINLS